MTLKTVPVTGTLYNPDGSVAANASVVATLTVVDTDGGIVVPSQVTATTDSGGAFTLHLWPNARGVNGSQYRVRAQLPGAQVGVLLANLLIMVPDGDPSVPVPIQTIINLRTPALTDAQAAVNTALGYMSAASGSATQTAADRVQTGLDRVQTGQDRTQTGIDRAAAAVSAAAAATSQAAAATSASTASTASQQASAAAVSAGAYPTAYAAALPRGVTAITVSAAGSGGTNGTYVGGVSGGPAGFAWTYTISGGAVTATAITNHGVSTATTAPTLSFPSGSLSGSPAATATVAPLVAQESTYWALNAAGTLLQLYKNNGTVSPIRIDGAAILVATSQPAAPIVDLMGTETTGFALNFMDDSSANQILVRTAGVNVYHPVDDFVTQANVVVPQMVYDAIGQRVFAPHNLFINSETPATQNVTAVVGETYTVKVTGGGSITVSGAGAGVATEGAPFTFTATTTTATCTKAGSPTRVQVNRGATSTIYLATGASARYGVAIDHDPVTFAPLGMRTDPGRTQYLLNNMTPATQTVSLAAGTYTVWMEGSGSVTLSGGPTNVVTAGAPATFTLGGTTSVTFTVAGTVNVFQCENGASKSGLLRTLGVAASRSANSAEILFSQLPALGSEYSAYVDFMCSDFTSGTPTAFRMRNAGDTEEFWVRGLAGGSGSWNAVSAGTSISKIYGTLVAGQRAQVTVRAKANSLLISQDGTHPNLNTQITLACPAPDRMYLGECTNGSVYIRRMIIVPRALGEGEIASWRYTYTTNPTKYRIIMLAGQSNLLNGNTLNPAIDIAGPKNFQIDQTGVVSAANENLAHPAPVANAIGFAVAFARDFLIPSGRLAAGEQVLLVPCGVGATGFSNNRWGVGNDLYCNAIGLTARAKAMFPNSTVDAIFWMQGESDATVPMSAAAYQAALDATLTGMRAQLGGSSIKIITGGMSPNWVALDSVNRTPIQNVLLDTPNRFTNAAYANPSLPSVITDTQDASLHYNATGQRTFAGRWWTAYQGL